MLCTEYILCLNNIKRDQSHTICFPVGVQARYDCSAPGTAAGQVPGRYMKSVHRGFHIGFLKTLWQEVSRAHIGRSPSSPKHSEIIGCYENRTGFSTSPTFWNVLFFLFSRAYSINLSTLKLLPTAGQHAATCWFGLKYDMTACKMTVSFTIREKVSREFCPGFKRLSWSSDS